MKFIYKDNIGIKYTERVPENDGRIIIAAICLVFDFGQQIRFLFSDGSFGCLAPDLTASGRGQKLQKAMWITIPQVHTNDTEIDISDDPMFDISRPPLGYGTPEPRPNPYITGTQGSIGWENTQSNPHPEWDINPIQCEVVRDENGCIHLEVNNEPL